MPAPRESPGPRSTPADVVGARPARTPSCCSDSLDVVRPQAGERVLLLGSLSILEARRAAARVGLGGGIVAVVDDPVAGPSRTLEPAFAAAGLARLEIHRVARPRARLPVEDRSVDVVVSRCGFDRAVHRETGWTEVLRVLRVGGRVCVSECARLRPLPAAVRELGDAVPAYVRDAPSIREVERTALDAGLDDVLLVRSTGGAFGADVRRDPALERLCDALPEGERPSDYLVRIDVTGRRP